MIANCPSRTTSYGSITSKHGTGGGRGEGGWEGGKTRTATKPVPALIKLSERKVTPVRQKQQQHNNHNNNKALHSRKY